VGTDLNPTQRMTKRGGGGKNSTSVKSSTSKRNENEVKGRRFGKRKLHKRKGSFARKRREKEGRAEEKKRPSPGAHQDVDLVQGKTPGGGDRGGIKLSGSQVPNPRLQKEKRKNKLEAHTREKKSLSMRKGGGNASRISTWFANSKKKKGGNGLGRGGGKTKRSTQNSPQLNSSKRAANVCTSRRRTRLKTPTTEDVKTGSTSQRRTEKKQKMDPEREVVRSVLPNKKNQKRKKEKKIEVPAVVTERKNYGSPF